MHNQKQRHLEIRHRLSLAGSSFSAIARSLDVSHTAVLAVSNGRSRSQRIAVSISTVLETTPEILWPEIYEEQCEDLK